MDETIQRNGFFAHPENILLAMIHDDQQSIRQKAYNKILLARNTQKMSTNIVRQFLVPTINFNAKTYCELVSWKNVDLTEPPLTKHLTNFELDELVKKGNTSQLWNYNGFYIPNHTQAVERCVKLVTETSVKVAGAERRDGYIRVAFASRSAMTTFQNKSQYQNFI